ncbi:hypothetical protein ElyMa_002924800 [Elysia marginata]|uniref:Shugoshin C-terminal domain-containing protein n=1 Tax=Elysia marginata TaxID=1093978 RepID=A0AAV4I3D8_9GAST|nr:hypothetical protein ElyMa_002924800 [Elysia marginata]
MLSAKRKNDTPSASPDDSPNDSRTEEDLLNISDNSINFESKTRQDVHSDMWQQRPDRIPNQRPEALSPGFVDPKNVAVEDDKTLQNGESATVSLTVISTAGNTADASANTTVGTEDSNPTSDLPIISPPTQTSERAISNKAIRSSGSFSSNNDSKKKKPQHVPASLSYEIKENKSGAVSPRARLRREERRSNSLDVPSIRIRSEDDSSDEDRNLSRSRSKLSNDSFDTSVTEKPVEKNVYLQPQNSMTIEKHNKKGDSSSAVYEGEKCAKIPSNEKTNEPPRSNASYRGTQGCASANRNPSMQSGGSSSGKPSTSYSLDFPEPKTLSLSINHLDPNKRRRSQGEGNLVEDKLITSNSMSCLPDGRR